MRKMCCSQKSMQFSVSVHLIPPKLEISLRSNRKPRRRDTEISVNKRMARDDALSKNSPLVGKLSRGVENVLNEMKSEKMNGKT